MSLLLRRLWIKDCALDEANRILSGSAAHSEPRNASGYFSLLKIIHRQTSEPCFALVEICDMRTMTPALITPEALSELYQQLDAKLLRSNLSDYVGSIFFAERAQYHFYSHREHPILLHIHKLSLISALAMSIEEDLADIVDCFPAKLRNSVRLCVEQARAVHEAKAVPSLSKNDGIEDADARVLVPDATESHDPISWLIHLADDQLFSCAIDPIVTKDAPSVFNSFEDYDFIINDEQLSKLKHVEGWNDSAERCGMVQTQCDDVLVQSDNDSSPLVVDEKPQKYNIAKNQESTQLTCPTIATNTENTAQKTQSSGSSLDNIIISLNVEELMQEKIDFKPNAQKAAMINGKLPLETIVEVNQISDYNQTNVTSTQFVTVCKALPDIPLELRSFLVDYYSHK